MPETSPVVSRPAADRCPGTLRLVEAADGFLARVRLPGGFASAGQLRALARLANELGDGRAELTSRGNVQLRGLANGAAPRLTSELAEAGLLPSLAHDRVRNVIASPLAGLDRGPDLTGLVRTLDAALCARPRLAELSGRFLFAVDDGRGDVGGPSADTPAADVTAVVQAASPGHDRVVVNGLSVACLPAGNAGEPADVAALADHSAAVMLAFAEAFLDIRAGAALADPTVRESPVRGAATGGGAWRIADLPDGGERVRAAVAARLGLTATERGPGAGTKLAVARTAPAAAEPAAAGGEPGAVRVRRPVGLVTWEGGRGGAESPDPVRDDLFDSAVLLAPLGRLTAAQLTWIADRLGQWDARVTPWRSVVLPRLPDAAAVLREAAGLGFGTDQASPWLRVTACAGRPGCASALADVQADAAGFAARWPGRLVHVSGCARHCGRPPATEIDVTATSEGYQVAGV